MLGLSSSSMHGLLSGIPPTTLLLTTSQRVPGLSALTEFEIPVLIRQIAKESSRTSGRPCSPLCVQPIRFLLSRASLALNPFSSFTDFDQGTSADSKDLLHKHWQQKDTPLGLPCP